MCRCLSTVLGRARKEGPEVDTETQIGMALQNVTRPSATDEKIFLERVSGPINLLEY